MCVQFFAGDVDEYDAFDDDDEIDRHFGSDGHSVRPWIAETPNTQRQLDRHDPYGCTSALSRPFPTDLTINALGIDPSDPVVRQWSSDTGPYFHAEAWGAEGGRGEQAWSEMGSRIFVSTTALKLLLERTERNLLILLKLRKYHRGRSRDRRGDAGAFTHRSLILVSNKHGEVWLPQRLSSKAKLAIDTLDADHRRDFYPRFRAIAGLPDEWLTRRKDQSVDAESFRILLKGLEADDLNL